MKKALILGAAVAAMSISSAASALSVVDFRGSAIRSDDLGQDVGVVFRLVSTGPVSGAPNYCGYRLLWQSPVNPSQVLQCNLREARTINAANCITNQTQNFNTSILAGEQGLNASSECHGFGPMGEELDDVTIIATELAGGTISGVMYSDLTGFLDLVIG